MYHAITLCCLDIEFPSCSYFPFNVKLAKVNKCTLTGIPFHSMIEGVHNHTYYIFGKRKLNSGNQYGYVGLYYKKDTW